MSRSIRLPLVVLFLLALFQLPLSAEADRWVMQDGTEYFGKPQAYDFDSKEITLLKADGKLYELDATKLSFSGKLQLFHTPAFGEALNNYSTPMAPILILGLAAFIYISLPLFLGVWGGAHVLGAMDSAGQHFIAVGKVLAIVGAQVIIYLVMSSVMDPELPIFPDKNGDILLFLCLLVMGLLVASLTLSWHYRQTFFRGMGIAFLCGVFSLIVFSAMALGTLFALMRADAETLMDRLVFEPLGWF